MFTCRFLARLSRNQASLASIGRLTIQQRLASHCILSSYPMAITNAMSRCKVPEANRRFASNEVETESSSLDSVTYDRVCSETLDALCDYFEELTENAADLQGSDVAYSVSPGSSWCLCYITLECVSFCFSAGWSAHCESGTQPRHLCDQPADAQQADMAQLPHQWSQAVRFCPRRRRRNGQVGLQAQWSVAARAAAAGDTEYIEAAIRGLSPPALL
ncbi:hypothetical protein KR038_006616, partial [Drosophila bunnanda]